MTHNLTKFNSSELNRAGEITAALSDLSDTAGTPTNNQVLMQSSSSWVAKTPPANAVAHARPTGLGENALTLVQDPSLENGWYYVARSRGNPGNLLNVFNDTNYATVYYRFFAINAQYFEHIELEPGYVYFLDMNFCIGGNSDAGSSVEVQWQDENGNALGPRAFIRQKGENRTPIRGVIDLTSAGSATDVGLQRVGSGINGNARYCLTADDIAQFNVTVRILT
jgi:hypothetical protein